MTTPLDIAEAARDFLITTIPAWISQFTTTELSLEVLDDEHIIIAWPDPDRYQAPCMIYLQPGEDESQPLTLATELHDMLIDIYIVCTKDTPERIMRKVFRYYAATKSALYQDRSMGGAVGELRIQSVDYYPNVEASPNTCAIKIGMTISYSEEL